jgi:hypothetical protein
MTILTAEMAQHNILPENLKVELEKTESGLKVEMDQAEKDLLAYEAEVLAAEKSLEQPRV